MIDELWHETFCEDRKRFDRVDHAFICQDTHFDRRVVQFGSKYFQALMRSLNGLHFKTLPYYPPPNFGLKIRARGQGSSKESYSEVTPIFPNILYLPEVLRVILCFLFRGQFPKMFVLFHEG